MTRESGRFSVDRKSRSRAKPKTALVGSPDGELIPLMAWKTWKIREWASTR
jgi:hypothetical protein